MATESDQGAYSCEAINSQGSCFAGSAGCGQPGQDAILVVATGSGVCPASMFNSAAVTRDQCVPCYCFGHADTCKSSDLYLDVLPPPTGVYHVVSVQLPSYSDPVPGQTSPTLDTLLSNTRDNGVKIFGSFPATRLSDDGPLYFVLPPSHAGNLLKSYGAHLKFKLRFGQSNGNWIDAPLVIFVGKDETLSYYQDELTAGEDNEISVRLWPDDMKLYPSLGVGGQAGGSVANREDIMTTLADVTMILIRAQLHDSGPVDTTVSDVRLETAGEPSLVNNMNTVF